MKTSVKTLLVLLTFPLLLNACGSAEDGDSDDPPPFNYIPLNDEACKIDAAPASVRTRSDAAISQLIAPSSNFVNTEIEVCGTPSGNLCPACKAGENRVGDLPR